VTPAFRPALPADEDRATRTVVEAFHADPVWSWAFPDPERRPETIGRLWRLIVRQGIANGGTQLAGDGDAVTVWVPPGLPEMAPDDEATVQPMLLEREPRRAGEIAELLHRFEANRPMSPHYYLSLFGTATAARGAGLGMALLRHTLGVVDAAGLPAYLESSNPRNDARYASVGFAVVGSFAAPNGGPVITTMWRDAKVDS
jgi:GNAT superfamily N-acetyltransferase